MSMVILGAIEMRKRTKLDGLAVYLGSLRQQNRSVRMVMFNRSPEHVGLRKLLNKYDVDIIDALAFDKAFDIPPVEIEIARFLEYSPWLDTNHFDRVLMTDVLDVVWQGDPDTYITHGMYAWQENRVIQDCRYNSKWVRECWPLSFGDMLEHPIVCCGVLVATYHDAMAYLGWYDAEFRSRGLDHVRRGFDSAMVNRYEPVTRYPYSNDTCMHLGYAPQADVMLSGSVVCEGLTPTIVHQYNRHPEVTKGLYERWT